MLTACPGQCPEAHLQVSGYPLVGCRFPLIAKITS
jgi:hypothetical protein